MINLYNDIKGNYGSDFLAVYRHKEKLYTPLRALFEARRQVCLDTILGHKIVFNQKFDSSKN